MAGWMCVGGGGRVIISSHVLSQDTEHTHTKFLRAAIVVTLPSAKKHCGIEEAQINLSSYQLLFHW